MAGGGQFPRGHAGGSDDAVTYDALTRLVAGTDTGDPFIKASTIGSNGVITAMQATDAAVAALIAARLVERKILGADATSVTFSGLDIAFGVAYRLAVQARGGTGVVAPGILSIRPNGLTTNQDCSYVYNGGNGIDTIMRIGGVSLAGIIYMADVMIYQSTGAGGRSALSSALYDQGGGGANKVIMQSGSRWTVDTNITTLDVVSSIANGLGAGSVLTLWALRGV